ncbi:MAG: Asp23/Gls24 family envelope stress response protein [Lachnospiraceae bacterium]|nr:Asp23/Gls24 family envelope stress response protein [Lachnospiraceae bacterium]
MNANAGTIASELGNVCIDSEVIAKYAGSAAVECFGIVGMAVINMKDGIAKLLKRENLTQGVGVTISQDNLITIDLHIIVSYGVSISAVASNLISDVRYKVEEFSGLKVEKINVLVEGVRAID